MNAAVENPFVSRRWKETKRLALLATFEDSETCTRAKEFCEGLSRDLGPDCKIIQHVWLFNTLRVRELQEIAAEEASVADLIIISAHQAAGLPEEVKSWIERWLRQKSARRMMLVALLDPVYDRRGSGSVRPYLEEVARRGGMELLIKGAEEL